MSDVMKVEGGASPEMESRIAEMKKESPELKVEVLKKPEVRQAVEVNLDKPKQEAKEAIAEPVDEDQDASEASATEDATPAPVQQLLKDLNESLESSKVDRAALVEELLKDHQLTVRVKGKDRKVSYHDIKSMIGREDTFQRKYDTLMGSEEGKMLTTMRAALTGDKAAVKRLHDRLVKAAKVSDGDGLLLEVEGQKDDFDEEKAHQEHQAKESWDTVFATVKDDVDYQQNVATIQTDLKSRMPSKVYEAYWNAPEARKSMYDLVKSGRTEELLGSLEKELETLPLSKQMEIESDPEAWGNLFIKVIRRANTKQTPKGGKVEGGSGKRQDGAGLSSVSSGAQGRRVSASQAAGTPNFLDTKEWTKEKFEQFQKENGLQ